MNARRKIIGGPAAELAALVPNFWVTEQADAASFTCTGTLNGMQENRP